MNLKDERLTRRHLLQGVVGTMGLLSTNALRAESPVLDPLSLEEVVRGHVRWIFTGQFRRVVYLSLEAERRLFTRDLVIPAAELRLYERQEIGRSSAAFIEIDQATPVLVSPFVPKSERDAVPTGRIYCTLGDLQANPELEQYLLSVVGREVVLLIHGRQERFGVARTSFPNPLVRLSGGRHWRDHMPLPLDKLPKVISIAEKLKFVRVS